MCYAIGVDRNTYYKSLEKTESTRDKENKELKSAIQKNCDDNRGRYGSPEIHYILVKEGYEVSHKRVQNLMRELNLYAITVKNTTLHQIRRL